MCLCMHVCIQKSQNRLQVVWIWEEIKEILRCILIAIPGHVINFTHIYQLNDWKHNETQVKRRDFSHIQPQATIGRHRRPQATTGTATSITPQPRLGAIINGAAFVAVFKPDSKPPAATMNLVALCQPWTPRWMVMIDC